jgi:hypothetical protein
MSAWLISALETDQCTVVEGVWWWCCLVFGSTEFDPDLGMYSVGTTFTVRFRQSFLMMSSRLGYIREGTSLS